MNEKVAEALRSALAVHHNEVLPAARTPHVCTPACHPTQCAEKGTVYLHGPHRIQQDHILQEHSIQSNGARHVLTIPVSALAHVLATAQLPLTYASATAALRDFEAARNGADSGHQKYLDTWHDEGLLP